ncbi:unnamed protein product [Arctia plantaginis]|uniref:Uncharacterized protein n=1 Tax=Arctia plantaginis TaxID=874455 RepID=A0A8S1A746_ARCPL|nr:unnamed protein product [Arctia plantaginis]CAB3240383.1 unnamed protein product [Arctia plantaginis]
MTCPVPVGERQGCSAMRMWRNATNTLVAPNADEAWQQVVDASPPDSLWHSLRNCVAYQAGVWQNLLNKGIDDVIQPAAFKLAIVLRHTPTERTVRLLSDMLRLHPQSQDLTSYILALLTDDEAICSGGCSSNESSSPTSPESSDENPQADDEESEPTIDSDNEAEAVPIPDDPTEKAARGDTAPRPDSPDRADQPDSATGANEEDSLPKPDSASGGVEPDSVEPDSVENVDGEGAVGGDLPPAPATPSGPAPLRDLQLFGDCELAVLAASREEYDAHAKLVRAEYSKLSQDNYVELRIKVLNQFSQIPKLFHTPEFECFEAAARENIEREICTLREHLLTGRKD